MRNSVPRPTSLSTWMLPPLCFTIPYTVASPSPVPLPIGLVVKNGSKTCAQRHRIDAVSAIHDSQHHVLARRKFEIARLTRNDFDVRCFHP